jgi:hypothetical protein
VCIFSDVLNKCFTNYTEEAPGSAGHGAVTREPGIGPETLSENTRAIIRKQKCLSGKEKIMRSGRILGHRKREVVTTY